MRTYTIYSDSAVPTANDVQFVAFYNGNDNLVQTEDSYNNDNNNTGWYTALGLTRAQTDQLPSVVGSSTYEIWITGLSRSEAGKATGPVGEINPSYTVPGKSDNKLILLSTNFLATPTGVSVTPGNGEALVRWNIVSGATGYRIYKRPVPANSNIIFQKVATISNGTTNYYVDTGLSNGASYYYIVVATTTTKMSGHNSELLVSPSASAPSITGPTTGSLNQTITVSGSNFGTSGTVILNGKTQSAVSGWTSISFSLTIDPTTPVGSGKLIVINNLGLEDSIDFQVTSTPSGSLAFTLIQNDIGNVNWISIPFNNTGLNTTVDLGNAIAGNFTPGEGDSITISSWDPLLQASTQTTGDFAGGHFIWDPVSGYPLVLGAMYKVSIYRSSRLAGETFNVGLTVSGEAPISGAFDFDLYHVDPGNVNWISIPWFTSGLASTVDLGNSIGTKFTPEEGDSLGIVVWDPTLQAGMQTTGDYIGGGFVWDPIAGNTIEKGRPYTVSVYRANRLPGQTFTFVWP